MGIHPYFSKDQILARALVPANAGERSWIVVGDDPRFHPHIVDPSRNWKLVHGLDPDQAEPSAKALNIEGNRHGLLSRGLKMFRKTRNQQGNVELGRTYERKSDPSRGQGSHSWEIAIRATSSYRG